MTSWTRNHMELLQEVNKGCCMQGRLGSMHACLPGCGAVRRTWPGAHVLLK